MPSCGADWWRRGRALSRARSRATAPGWGTPPSLGALLGGAGHLLSGLPLRGALHVFVFLFLLLRWAPRGWCACPTDRRRSAQQLALLLLVLAPLHLLSLRSLRRRQARAESEAS